MAGWIGEKIGMQPARGEVRLGNDTVSRPREDRSRDSIREREEAFAVGDEEDEDSDEDRRAGSEVELEDRRVGS